MKRYAALLLGAFVLPAWADPPTPIPAGWKAEAELGLINTTGNRQTSTLNARVSVERESTMWRNKAQAEYLRASDNTGVTARRTVAQFTTNYKFSERDYIFGNLRREADRFAGYDYRYSETTGYGHRFRWRRQRLDLEAGAGANQAKLIDGTRRRDGIWRLAMNYAWKFSQGGELTESAFSEIGSANTHTESETALKQRIRGRLAMKLSYRILNDTHPPPGTLRTDTITAVTLVYDFGHTVPSP